MICLDVGSGNTDHGEPFGFEDIFSADYLPRTFEAQWVGGESMFFLIMNAINSSVSWGNMGDTLSPGYTVLWLTPGALSSASPGRFLGKHGTHVSLENTVVRFKPDIKKMIRFVVN